PIRTAARLRACVQQRRAESSHAGAGERRLLWRLGRQPLAVRWPRSASETTRLAARARRARALERRWHADLHPASGAAQLRLARPRDGARAPEAQTLPDQRRRRDWTLGDRVGAADDVAYGLESGAAGQRHGSESVR